MADGRVNEALRYALSESAVAWIVEAKRAHRAMDPTPFPDLPWGCTCGRAFATQRGRSIHTSVAHERDAA